MEAIGANGGPCRPCREGGFFVRRSVLTIIVMLAASPVLAGASSTPVVVQPDPTAANLTPYEISLRTFDACLITQSRLMNQTREQVHTPCSCYAKRTVSGMNKEELANFRKTGWFDDTTRQKALEAIDYCKLKRPI